MKYISIDIETSGLDPEKNNLLSIGAIIEDTEKRLSFREVPKFNAIILQKEIQGSPKAISMNQGIISMIGDYVEGSKETKESLKTNSGYKFLEKEEVAKEFYWWLEENGFSVQEGIGFLGGMVTVRDGKMFNAITSNTKPITINVAGKNFGTFDKLFLEKLPWWQKLIKVRQRIIDPSILCVDWAKDETLPSLTVCKQRCTIEGEVTHTALEDAWDVIQVLRRYY